MASVVTMRTETMENAAKADTAVHIAAARAVVTAVAKEAIVAVKVDTGAAKAVDTAGKAASATARAAIEAVTAAITTATKEAIVAAKAVVTVAAKEVIVTVKADSAATTTGAAMTEDVPATGRPSRRISASARAVRPRARARSLIAATMLSSPRGTRKASAA